MTHHISMLIGPLKVNNSNNIFSVGISKITYLFYYSDIL